MEVFLKQQLVEAVLIQMSKYLRVLAAWQGMIGGRICMIERWSTRVKITGLSFALKIR